MTADDKLIKNYKAGSRSSFRSRLCLSRFAFLSSTIAAEQVRITQKMQICMLCFTARKPSGCGATGLL